MFFMHAAHKESIEILIDPSAPFASIWVCLFSSLPGPIKVKEKKKAGAPFAVSTF